MVVCNRILTCMIRLRFGLVCVPWMLICAWVRVRLTLVVALVIILGLRCG